MLRRALQLVWILCAIWLVMTVTGMLDRWLQGWQRLIFFVIFFGLLIAIELVPEYLSSRRLKRGCCPQCGYDLRATPERCPECGMIQSGASLASDAGRGLESQKGESE